MRKGSGFFLLFMLLLTGARPGRTQSIAAGISYLTSRQEADGGWRSHQVRLVQATTEALRALQAVGQAPAARTAAAGLLAREPVQDGDDRARRIPVLAAEGRSVESLVSTLAVEVDREGGWGLNPQFPADPLDTALALSAVGSQPVAGDYLVRTPWAPAPGISAAPPTAGASTSAGAIL